MDTGKWGAGEDPDITSQETQTERGRATEKGRSPKEMRHS